MAEREGSFIANIDWQIILLYLGLLIFGWFNIYSAEYQGEASGVLNLSQNHGKQIIWIVASGVLGVAILILNSRFFSTFAYLVYGIILGLLILTLFAGKEVSGSTSWLQIGGFGLQTSEFAKFATLLALTKYLNNYEVYVNRFKDAVWALAIILVPILLIILQNDVGTALIFPALIFVLFRQGLPGYFLYLPIIFGVLFLSVLLFNKFIVLGVLIGLGSILTFVLKNQKSARWMTLLGAIVSIGFIFGVDYAFNNLLQPHQQERINVLLGKEVDIKGAGYNIHQSLIAIGSGGLNGKGFLEGTQTKFDFVPEQTTDFIFCTVGEEYGWIGSAALILVYTWLLLRIVLSAESQKARFARIYGYGVASILFLHFAINIGMTIGLLPVVGIPLPLFSYGGSSLLGFTFLIFIYLNLDASQRTYFV